MRTIEVLSSGCITRRSAIPFVLWHSIAVAINAARHKQAAEVAATTAARINAAALVAVATEICGSCLESADNVAQNGVEGCRMPSWPRIFPAAESP